MNSQAASAAVLSRNMMPYWVSLAPADAEPTFAIREVAPEPPSSFSR